MWDRYGRKLAVAIAIAILLAAWLWLLAPESRINVAINLGYLGLGILVVGILVWIANTFKITGALFHLGDWMDAIDKDPSPYRAIAIAVVIAGMLVAAGSLVGPFIRPG